MENKIRVFVGFGNPGPQFLWTRHNAGFDVIDVLAQTMNVEFVEDPDLKCLIARPNSSIALVKPQTGMNDSGLTVKALLEKLDTSMDSVMIIYDDIAMPLGRLRFAEKGSAGGHHGIESTLRELSGNSSFPRLKVAVGPDVKSGDLRAAFLLSPIEADLRELYLRSVSVAAEACQLWLTKPIAACMGRYNGLDLTRPSAS